MPTHTNADVPGSNPGAPIQGTAASAEIQAEAPDASRTKRLSAAMADLLWTVAQHKYGWAHCPNVGRSTRRLQVAEALERRGLVTVDRESHDPTCAATEAGRAEITRRWPVSPFVLGTYDHQPGGWTPRDSVDRATERARPIPRERATKEARS